MAHRRVRQRGAAHRWPVVLQDPAVPLSAEIWPQIQVDGPAEGGTVGESQGTRARGDDTGIRRTAGYPRTLGWDDADHTAQANGYAYA